MSCRDKPLVLHCCAASQPSAPACCATVSLNYCHVRAFRLTGDGLPVDPGIDRRYSALSTPGL